MSGKKTTRVLLSHTIKPNLHTWKCYFLLFLKKKLLFSIYLIKNLSFCLFFEKKAIPLQKFNLRFINQPIKLK